MADLSETARLLDLIEHAAREVAKMDPDKVAIIDAKYGYPPLVAIEAELSRRQKDETK